VLRSYHPLERLDPLGDPAARFWTMRAFYEEIRPRAFVQREIDAFASAHLADAFVIGVNVSTGNGEFSKGETFAGRVNLGIFADERTFLVRMARARRRALRGLPRDLRGRVKIFVATDSYAMRDLLMKLPDAVTRRTTFPPPGVGRVFCDYDAADYTDRDAIVDALADMFLLARCHALVRNGSVFNAYATTVTAHFGGNVQHIEKLYASYWITAARNHLARRFGR
jgi:Nodulation protein Z (NodZ)